MSIEIMKMKDSPHAEDPTPLLSEASHTLSSRIHVNGDRAELLDTHQSVPIADRVGSTDPNAEISVTVMVKSKASDEELNQTLQKIINGQQKPLSDAEFNSRFGADQSSMFRIEKFASDNHLKVSNADANSGQVKLNGSVKDFEHAFHVQLDNYKTGQNVNHKYSGNISVPMAIAGDVEGVFGLDNTPIATSHSHAMRTLGTSPKDNSASFLPNQVADAYNFPKESMGSEQSVGIIELAGGLDRNGNTQYYKDHGFKEPTLQTVGVDGANNSPGKLDDAEVALDSQVIGVVAPDANQQLIFAPNTSEGFVDGIARAIFPEAGEKQNTAISISWGAPETAHIWTTQAIKNMDNQFKKAALKGISVFVATGDHGATDGTENYATDFPATDPFVTATGGTQLSRDGKEVVWNDGVDLDATLWATGGGISSNFDVPEFQKGISLPANADLSGKHGRGSPDIAGNASEKSPYLIRYGGSEKIVFGTSAVAPLYAGLMMRVNGALGHPVGYLNPFLYENGHSDIFKDITSGTNNGYNAGTGWDACTGWGSINGQKFLNALRAQGK